MLARLKGGTSLSKAYRLIQRFSEDVDLIAVLPAGGVKSKDSALKAFVAGAAAVAGLRPETDSGTTTKGVKRTAVFTYPTVHGSGHAATEGDDVRKAATARHYYDVDRLLRNDDVLAQLSDPPIDVLAREVCEHSRAAELPTADRPKGGFASSPAWGRSASRVAADAYNSLVLTTLVWPGAPRSSFDECCQGVHNLAAAL